MSKLLKLLDDNIMTLIVSLPQNSVELAKAAEEGGADVIKIHMNMTHAASGTTFGSFEQEKKIIKEIVNSVKVPVGIVPGYEVLPSQKDMDGLSKIGVDYFDLFQDKIQDWMFDIKDMGKIAALSEEYSIERLTVLRDLKMDCFEAAIVPKNHYGASLTVGDLQNYITICISSPLPVIVPTQKYIRVSDIPILWDAGVSAVMIGTIVTGDTPGSILSATKKYKAAMNDLGE